MTFRPDPKPVRRKKEKWNHAFYQQWWGEGSHTCEECGRYLPWYDPRCVHHLIERNQQHKYRVDISHNTDNLMKLCYVCHDQVRLNIDKVPNVKKRTGEALKNFEKYSI